MVTAKHLSLDRQRDIIRRKESRIKILSGRKQYRDISGRASVALRFVTLERQTLQPCNQHTHDLHNIIQTVSSTSHCGGSCCNLVLTGEKHGTAWMVTFPKLSPRFQSDRHTYKCAICPPPPKKNKSSVLIYAVHSDT